ncbi:MAG: hypothetical protein B6I30_03255 [Desulfobacteraceae bacterium 4572_187]|nr:MAG: hypothetical protein B6I30_03255 [Desulfobacteraceae bacterium 4572_187]
MKYLSFKILILCILLPPILYIFSLQSIERHLNKRYAKEIGDIYTGDTRPLFDGSVRLQDAINNNIDRYLQSKAILSWGVKAKVTVATKQNTILYPAVFNDEEVSVLPSAPIQVAADNYNLMNEGLVVNVDVILEHNTLLSNTILAFYICISVLVLFLYYKAGIKKARQEDTEKETELARLLEFEKNHTSKLKDLIKVKQKLISEIIKIKNKLVHERIRASKNEDDLIKEIVALEENINENIALQNEKQKEINALKEKIKLLEKERQKENKQKTNSYNIVRKRLKTLYKNISVNKRAINGFIDLTDDMKIKGEEIIHKLNEDPSFVSVKRKVFGKKGRATVQEVIFSYKGRLYFRKKKDGQIEILTIGTKNTQAKDLEFLDSI